MNANPLSIIFAGTSLFAVPSLRALAAHPGFRIESVITQPDRPVGRKQALTAPPVKAAALELGLPVFQPEKLNREHSLKKGSFDFLVVVSYGQILSGDILALPRIAPVNVHASLLPRWRGASPIQHAILAGDHETGVTVQIMEKELDSGPVLAQAQTSVGLGETAVTLHDRLSEIGAQLILETLLSPLAPVPQDPQHVTVCGKLSREDGSVDPEEMTAEEIDRRVRALTPWPGVTIMLTENDALKVMETSLEEIPESYPLPCAGGTILHLRLVQPAGGKPMSGTAWARGRK